MYTFKKKINRRNKLCLVNIHAMKVKFKSIKVHGRSANENNLVFNEMICFNEDEKLFNLILVYKILIDFLVHY